MYPLLPAALLALLWASLALAFDKITIAGTVQVDTPTEVRLVNDVDTGDDSFDAGFTNFRTYLALSPPGWGWGPACYLANSTDIKVTSVNVTIPANVVPDGTKCMISTMEWNKDPEKPGPSGFQYSGMFTLKGGRGVWSRLETDGRSISDADSVPCSSYQCVRDCGMQFYPANSNPQDDEAFLKTYECIAACPGVTVKSTGTAGNATSTTGPVPTRSGASSSGNSPAATTTTGGQSSQTPNSSGRVTFASWHGAACLLGCLTIFLL